jgi:ankyrin repeat protein
MNNTNKRVSKSNRLTRKNNGGSPSSSPKSPKASTKSPKASTKSPKASKKPEGPKGKEKELALDLLAEFKKPKKTFDIAKVREILADKKWKNKWIDFEDIDAARNKPGITALRSAVAKGDIEAVELLLQNGADVNKQNQKTGHTALHTAVSNNGLPEEMIKMIKLLLEKGATTDLEAKPLGTPLESAEHYAETQPETYKPIVAFLKEHK